MNGINAITRMLFKKNCTQTQLCASMNHWLITVNHIIVPNMNMLLKSNPFNAKIIIPLAKQLESSHFCVYVGSLHLYFVKFIIIEPRSLTNTCNNSSSSNNNNNHIFKCERIWHLVQIQHTHIHLRIRYWYTVSRSHMPFFTTME